MKKKENTLKMLVLYTKVNEKTKLQQGVSTEYEASKTVVRQEERGSRKVWF